MLRRTRVGSEGRRSVHPNRLWSRDVRAGGVGALPGLCCCLHATGSSASLVCAMVHSQEHLFGRSSRWPVFCREHRYPTLHKLPLRG